jgi:acyl carrier protein
MIFEKLARIVAEQFGVDAEGLTMDTAFDGDLNADSLDIVELSMALEEEFGVSEMTEEELGGIATIGDLVRYLQSKVD